MPRTTLATPFLWLLALATGLLLLAAAPARATTLSTGYDTSCSVSNDWGAQCWGAVPLARTSTAGIADLRAGKGFNCALRKDETASCWGNMGSLSFGPATADTPGQAIAGVREATQLVVGATHACALSGAVVYCWGDGSRGQRGAPVSATPSAQATYAQGLHDVARVAAGNGSTCGVKRDGTVWCYGSGTPPLTTLGGMAPAPGTGIQVPGISDAVDVALFDGHACVLRKTGAIACWGSNAKGELGTAASATPVTTPVEVPGLGSPAKAVAVGPGYTCAVLTNGTVKCWGGNPDMQLGIGYQRDSATPATGQVLGIIDATAIGTGATHACAVLDGGYVNCWGAGLGRGDGLCTTVGAYYPGVQYSYPTSNLAACFNGASATPYAVQDLGPLADANLVMDWAEASLPRAFPPQFNLPSPSGRIGNYLVRAYPGNTYLAVNGHGTPHLMYLGPDSGGQLADLGRLAPWVRQARASQPTTPPISTTLQLKQVLVNVDFFPGPPRTSCNNLSVWFWLGATAGNALPAGFKPTAIRLLKGDTYLDVPNVGEDSRSPPPPGTYTGRAWSCPATLIRGDDEVEVVLYFTIDGEAGQVRTRAKVMESS
ncbi:Regulator of chromosome condensation (RCC1) repeat containing protein [Acidovorax sp. CF316]|uniref:RCC1 domain-containing protein n=1 Tax=Acidovorax sp. CF316 TaxID=1144317 RepID=UPI00026BCB53|nr:Regulator of chromosome condensation (RCC1) repeat containing protein [Acidovorax sp. CF316]EJE52237.1 Regulator of chromosome condensation (RCC1) repeat containing protein [Acidovorax sp. CF316]